MIEWILWGLIAAAVGAAVVVYWDHIKVFLKHCYLFAQKLIELIKIGTKIFLKRMQGYIEEVCKIYTKNQMGQWEVVTQIQKVPESEIPLEIRNKLKNMQEVDITNDIQNKIAV